MPPVYELVKLFGVVYTMGEGAKMQAAMMKGSIPMEMKKISIQFDKNPMNGF